MNLYNQEQKNKFLQMYEYTTGEYEIEEGITEEDIITLKKAHDFTIKAYGFIFEKASEMEIVLNKDVCEFSPSELDTLIKSYNSKSIHKIQSIKTILSKYIDWCIEQRFIIGRSITKMDNREEIINCLNGTYGVLITVLNKLIDENTNDKQFDYVTSPRLSDAFDKVNDITKRINDIIYQKNGALIIDKTK